MNATLPTKSYTQYQFNCPKCDWPWWFSEKQLSHPRFMFVCECTTAFKPKLELFSIHEPTKEPKKEQIKDIVIDMLVAQGWSKRESQQRVNLVYSESKDFETLLRDAILNGYST